MAGERGVPTTPVRSAPGGRLPPRSHVGTTSLLSQWAGPLGSWKHSVWVPEPQSAPSRLQTACGLAPAMVSPQR